MTGVSAGIGHGLADHYLESGCEVFGISRRTPDDLINLSNFHFAAGDLADPASTETALKKLLASTDRLELVVLNAGVVGRFGDLMDADPADLCHTMQVNVWANITLLNGIFSRGIAVRQVVAISSGASVNGHRGLSGYSISKAALNMMVKLYAHEQPETHFCAFAPGVVDTHMQEVLCGRDPDERYPAVEILRGKRGTPEMPTPATVAPYLASAMSQLPELVSSGHYADIRELSL